MNAYNYTSTYTYFCVSEHVVWLIITITIGYINASAIQVRLSENYFSFITLQELEILG